MKVIIITPFEKNSTRNGESRYSTELIKNLLKISNKNRAYKVLYPRKKLNFLEWMLYDLIILPLRLFKTNADLYHATSPGEVIAPVLLRKKTIVTVQDVIYLTYPEGINLLRIIYFKICAIFIKKANIVVTGSDFSKREINHTLKIPLNKIKKVYLGIDEEFIPMKNKNNEKRIGYLGGNKGRKNVIALIKAFNLIYKKSQFKSYKLILSINPTKELLNLIKKLKAKNIEFKGNISENNIVGFYNSLSLFVYPSLYEGFGLPPLEAMRCGCPVICSNETSVGEIVGNAAITINMRNPKEIADSMEKILHNTKIKKKLQIKGTSKSKQYTWEKTAINTSKIYELFA